MKRLLITVLTLLLALSCLLGTVGCGKKTKKPAVTTAVQTTGAETTAPEVTTVETSYETVETEETAETEETEETEESDALETATTAEDTTTISETTKTPETESPVTECVHNYATVTTDPTCTVDGSKVSTCSKCGDTKIETVPATGHAYENSFCANCGVMQELIVIDNEYCMIKITAIDPNDFWGYTLKAFFENKSSDKTYTFSVLSASINGIECDPFFATEVAAGKKSNDSISFSVDTLVKNGVTNFTDIELTFRVYDSNDWSAEDITLQTVHVYPFGEDKASKFIRETKATDHIIMDNELVTIIVTGYEFDNTWGYTANLFLVNKTNSELMFCIDESSVNGYMIDPFFASSVASGKCKFISASWSNEALIENGIEEVDEIEFLLRVYNYNDWFADDLVNMVVTLNP